MFVFSSWVSSEVSPALKPVVPRLCCQALTCGGQMSLIVNYTGFNANWSHQTTSQHAADSGVTQTVTWSLSLYPAWLLSWAPDQNPALEAFLAQEGRACGRPELAAGIMYVIWPGNTSGSPRRSRNVEHSVQPATTVNRPWMDERWTQGFGFTPLSFLCILNELKPNKRRTSCQRQNSFVLCRKSFIVLKIYGLHHSALLLLLTLRTRLLNVI